MSKIAVNIAPASGMDVDSDGASVRGSRVNYNIRSVTDEGNDQNSTYLIRGNELVFEVPEPVAQNIRIRILRTDESVATSYTATVIFAAGLSFPLTFDWATLRADIEADLDITIGEFTVTTFFSNASYYDINIIYDPGTGFPMTFVAGDGLVITTLLEPISAQLTAPYYCIGSYDLLLNLFLFLTNKPGTTKLVGNVSAITSGGAGTEQVTITAHGLTTGDYIYLTGLGGVTNINNQNYWVEVNDANTITIAVLYTGTYTSGGVATTDVMGVSEIGVAIRDSQTENWTYTMLLRSLQLNYDRAHCIDVDGEYENNQYSLYYTDNLGKLRLFYYIGDFTFAGSFREYGALSRPQGLYLLNTVDAQTSLVPSFGKAGIELVEQRQVGGALLSGNHRYAYRLLSEGGAATEWTYLSRPIPVFTADGTDYAVLLGDVALEVTSKVNVLSVTFDEGIPTIFKYIQWAYVRYEEDSFFGAILPRETLQIDESTYTLVHTGDEAEEALDVGTLNEQRASYDTAKNIRILDNRLVISNIRSFYNNIDLAPYLSGATYTVEKKTFSGVTSQTGGGTVIGTSSYVNMYQKVENVFYFSGYMQHEYYDFYAAAEYFNGQIGQPQHLATVLFEPDATTSFTDYRISSVFLAGNDVSVFVPYVNWVLPEGSTLVDGKMVSSFIKRFHIFRAERTRPTILGNAIAVMGTSGRIADPLAGANPGKIVSVASTDQTGIVGVGGAFPFADGTLNASFQPGSAIAPLPYPSTGGATSDFVALQQFLSIYYPDDILKYPAIADKTIVPRTSGDYIINHGIMDVVAQTWPPQGGAPLPSDMADYTIDLSGVVTDIATPPEFIDVEEGTTARDILFTVAGQNWSRLLWVVVNNTAPASVVQQYFTSPSAVIKIASDPSPIDVGTDNGVRWIYYGRTVTNQYDQLTDQLVPTGTQITISETATTNADVFGGDVYTQECYLQWRSVVPTTQIFPGYGSGIRFFSQNTHNWQLRNNNNGGNTYQYPVMPVGNTAVFYWLTQARHQLFYNNGYDWVNKINVLRPYDSSVNYDEDLRATIAWSQLKPQGSKSDSYRVFLPLDHKGLDSRYGEITHHEVINGELFTIQLRNMMRQFFNSTGRLVSANTVDIIIGNGSVLQSRGIVITTYGSRNKFAIRKGRSRGGNDVLYVPDQENKIIWRFGADGLQPISILHNIHSLLKRYFKWVDADAPVDNNGMCAVWNEQHSEYIITSRVRRNLDYGLWDGITEFLVGSIVKYADPTKFNDFDLPGYRLYEAVGTPNFDVTPGSDDDIWKLIELDDTDYYNLFSLVYSEKEDRFKTLLTPHPLLYITYSNTYLTQSPITLGFYLNDIGLPGVWWDDGVNVLEADGYFTPVFNYAPDDMKQLENVQIRSTQSPFRVEITTENRQTYMTTNDGDFYAADELGYVAPIKNDSTITIDNPSGLNNIDTDSMYGRIVDPVKIFFEKRIIQKINSIILSIQLRFPNIKNK